MHRKARVHFAETSVLKTGDPLLLAIEVEKSRRAGRIGKDSGLFRVPEVMDFDPIQGTARFERIHGLRTIQEVSWMGKKGTALGERIGNALAIIHRDLKLPSDMVIRVPAEFDSRGQDVFLHGDFGFRNIGLDPESGTLVVLDWQFVGLLGGVATYGSRYFDLVWFVNNLLWRPRLGYLVGDPVRPVARAFLRSYYRAAGIAYDGEGLSRYAENFFRIRKPERRQRMSRRYRIFVPRCHRLTERFIRDVATDPAHG